MGKEYAAVESLQLIDLTSLELLTFVKVKMGVTVKLEEKVSPSEVVVVKFIMPVSFCVASVAVT